MDGTAAVGIGAAVIGSGVGLRAVADLTQGSRLRARLKDYSAIRAQLPEDSKGSEALLLLCERLVRQLVRVERRSSRARLLVRPTVSLMFLVASGVIMFAGGRAGVTDSWAEGWKYLVAAFGAELVALAVMGRHVLSRARSDGRWLVNLLRRRQQTASRSDERP